MVFPISLLLPLLSLLSLSFPASVLCIPQLSSGAHLSSSNFRSSPRYASLRSKLSDVASHLSASIHDTNSSSGSIWTGYNFAPCGYHRDCRGFERNLSRCLRGDFTSACDGAAQCMCVNEQSSLCNTCEQCGNYPHETCIPLADSIIASPNGKELSFDGFCASAVLVKKGYQKELGCDTVSNATPMPADVEEDEGDSDDSDSDSYKGGGGHSTAGSTYTPWPSPSPSPSPSTSQSPHKEVDNQDTQDADSEKDREGGDDSSDDSCVDAELLKHLDGAELVYSTARRASVLCDETQSCATAGHIVVYKGRTLTMRAYCQSIASSRCQKRIRFVNSPRMLAQRRNGRRSWNWTMKVRVRTKTSNLEFTPFASRFETGIEMAAMRIVVDLLGF